MKLNRITSKAGTSFAPSGGNLVIPPPMLTKEFPYTRAGSSTIADEYLVAWERIQHETRLTPGDRSDAARNLLEEHFGAAEQPIATGFAPAAISLLTEHCDYFPGFGLLMPLPVGVAVAVREAGSGSNAVEDAEDVFKIGHDAPDGPGMWHPMLKRLYSEICRDAGVHLEVAVSGARREAAGVARLSCTLIAFCRALKEGGFLEQIDRHTLKCCHEVIRAHLGIPVSVAGVLGAHAVDIGKMALVDTETFETMTLDLPDRQRAGWGLVQMGRLSKLNADVIARRQEQILEATELLRRGHRFRINTLRELEHRDLKAALNALPAELVAPVRFVVSENARVQRLVSALRRQDWQFFGALLLMSHAGLRDDLGLGSVETDFVVAEANMAETIYGARRVGRSFFGNVLCLGQPFALLKFLDRVDKNYHERFGTHPHTVLL